MVCFMVVWIWAQYWCPVIHLVAQATEFTTICCSSVVKALYFSFHQCWLLLSEILIRASLGHYGLSGTEEAVLQSRAENNKDEPGNCINKCRLLRSKFCLKVKFSILVSDLDYSVYFRFLEVINNRWTSVDNNMSYSKYGAPAHGLLGTKNVLRISNIKILTEAKK